MCNKPFKDSIHFDMEANIFKCTTCMHLVHPLKYLVSHHNDWKNFSVRIKGFADICKNNQKAQGTIDKYIFKDNKFSLKNEEIMFEDVSKFIEFSQKHIDEALRFKLNQSPQIKEYKEVLEMIEKILDVIEKDFYYSI